jgi:hypothetical protein
MHFKTIALATACAPLGVAGFVTPLSKSFGISTFSSSSSSSKLSMVLEKPRTEKKLAKIEVLKTKSDHLLNPLKDVSMFFVFIFYWNTSTFLTYKGNIFLIEPHALQCIILTLFIL